MKTEVIDVDPQFPDLGKIKYCANIIRNGGLVIFPTETVYGIAADFTNPKAIRRLSEVKKRSDDKKYSVIISQKSLVSNYTYFNEPIFYKLMDSFWPGPLTIIVPSKETGQTIGLRVPHHNIALRLTAECPFAVAAPSANFEGKPAPTTCAEALKDLDGLVDAAINGGPARIGLSSTVVDISQSGKLQIVREGAVSKEDIQKTAQKKVILFVCTGNSCRSVMGEYLLRHMVKDRNDLDIVSAGTGVFIQSTASSETISVLKDLGINATGHISRPISGILLRKADLIFVMTRQHRQQVLERVPEVEKRIYLLGEFCSSPSSFQSELDIPDPIGRTHQDYQDCLNVIKEAVLKIKELV